MADERLDFELDIDVEARRLPQAVQQLALMEGHLGRLDRSIERFERSTRAMDASAGRMRNVAGSITELSSAIGLLSRGLAVGASAFAAFDRGGDVAIKAMGERSGTIRSLTTLLGSRPQADLEFYRAQDFSQRTDFKSGQIEAGQNTLITGGFRDKDLYRALFAASDLGAAGPADKMQERFDAGIRAFTKVRGKGYLTLDELNEEFLTAGLSPQIVRQLAKKKFNLKSDEEVEKAFSEKKIRGSQAENLIYESVMQQLNTKKLGEFSTGSAGSLTGLISNRDEAIQNVLKGFDADANLPAMDRYKKALQEQGKLFDINSKTGRDLSLVIQDLSNASLEAKSAWTEFSSGLVESFAENYSRNLRANGRDFNPEFTSQALRNLGEAIGRLGTLASMAVGGVNGASGGLAQRLANAFNKDVDMWTAVMDGRYGAAAKLAAGSLMDRVPGTRAAKELARSVYDWEAGGNLESREDKGFTPRMGRTGPTIPTDTASRKAEQKRLEAAAKSGKSDAYRGVFWDYQFDGSIGVWAKPPSVESLSAAQQVSVRGISQAIQAQAGQQQITIQILGYNKDKMELARALAEELGRVARSPR